MRKQIAVVFCTAVFQRVSILLIMTFSVRIMGVTEFGKFSLAYYTAVNLIGFFGETLAVTANKYINSTNFFNISATDLVKDLLSLTLKISSWILIVILSSSFFMLLLLKQVSFYIACLYIFSGLLMICQLHNIVLFAILNNLGSGFLASVFSCTGSFCSMLIGFVFAYFWGALGLLIGVLLGLLITTVSYYTYLLKTCYPGWNIFKWTDLSNIKKAGIIKKFIIPTLATMALGGPVHWVCLIILSTSKSGIENLAIFTAFFQWYSLLTFIPYALSNFTIPWLSRSKSLNDGLYIKNSIKIMGLITAIQLMLLSFIYLFKNPILSLYGHVLMAHSNTLLLLCLCGFLSSIVVTLNQILLADEKASYCLFANIFYSILYIISTIFLVRIVTLGSVGLSLSLLISSLLQISIQLYFIFGKNE